MWQEIIQTKKGKIALLSLLFFILAIIIISVSIMINRSGKIEVSFEFQPAKAQVFLDDSNQDINHKTIYLPEGNYTLHIAANNYIYQQIEINVNNYNQAFLGALLPINASEIEIDDILEELATDEKISNAPSSQQLTEKYPLIAYLPYSTKVASYTISYNFNENFSSLKITIDPIKQDDYIAVNSARTILNNLAEKANVLLPSYDIIFNNYTNMFIGHFQENTQSDPYKFLQTGYSNLNHIEIQEGQISGNYYYTTIKQLIPIDGVYDDYVAYHVILKKSDNSWELVSEPELLLTTYNTPNTAVEILNLANNYFNGS